MSRQAARHFSNDEGVRNAEQDKPGRAPPHAKPPETEAPDQHAHPKTSCPRFCVPEGLVIMRIQTHRTQPARPSSTVANGFPLSPSSTAPTTCRACQNPAAQLDTPARNSGSCTQAAQVKNEVPLSADSVRLARPFVSQSASKSKAGSRSSTSQRQGQIQRPQNSMSRQKAATSFRPCFQIQSLTPHAPKGCTACPENPYRH